MGKMMGALIGVLLIASEVQAATVTTAPLEPEPNGTLVCEAVNVSSRERDVTLWIFDGNGILVTFNECFDLAMGAMCSSSTTSDAARYCKVIVEGGKGLVRASLTARSETNVTTAAVPAF